jgi:hypothetical protein
MQRNARTNINAAWGGAGAFGVASLPGNLIVCGFGKCSRRRRSYKSVASAIFTVSVERVAFATFTARALLLRRAARPACGHRRLTTRSSGRAKKPRAAYLGR